MTKKQLDKITKAEREEALHAITSFRRLRNYGLLSEEERASILKKIDTKYGKYLSPLRTVSQAQTP